MNYLVLGLITLLFGSSFAQQTNIDVEVETSFKSLYGTLTLPSAKMDTSLHVVLIIAGSGPTDRDGNNPVMVNNSLKMVGNELASFNIASLRYDKRGAGESRKSIKSESDMLFHDNVADANYFLQYLIDKGFSKIIIAGHSEGSLVGMILAKEHPEVIKYISLAGAGRPIGTVLKEQYGATMEVIRDSAYVVIDNLEKGILMDTLSPWLFSVFRPSVQPYIISWMQYNPSDIIKELSIPVLVIQGTTDIQVSVEDAQNLKSENEHVDLKIITDMNHIFKKVSSDKKENRATYKNPDLPLHPDLLLEMVNFIRM